MQKKLVATGTCFEFGLTTGPVSVSQAVAPNTPYSQSKNYVHQAAQRIIGQGADIDFTWARIFYVYGDGQHEKSFYSLLKSAIDNKHETFPMSRGEQLFDYLEISEVAGALLKIATEKSPKVVHICRGEAMSLRRLAEETIAKHQSPLKLDLGFYPYRKEDSIAVWGAESLEAQFEHLSEPV